MTTPRPAVSRKVCNDLVTATFIPVSHAIIEGLNKCIPAATRYSQGLKSVQKLSADFPPSPSCIHPQVIDKKTVELGAAGNATY